MIIFTLPTLVCVCSFHRGSIIDTIHRVASVISRWANKKALSLVVTYGFSRNFRSEITPKFSNFRISRLRFRNTENSQILRISWKIHPPPFPSSSQQLDLPSNRDSLPIKIRFFCKIKFLLANPSKIYVQSVGSCTRCDNVPAILTGTRYFSFL